MLHPEVQWEEEANFILGRKLTHVSGSKGGHTLGTQGAGTGLLPAGTGEVHPTYTATMPSPQDPGCAKALLPFPLVPETGGIRGYVGP